MKIAAEASATRDGNRVSHESRTSVEADPETDDVVSIEPAEEEVSARRSTPSSSSPSSPRSAEDAARNPDEEGRRTTRGDGDERYAARRRRAGGDICNAGRVVSDGWYVSRFLCVSFYPRVGRG